MLAGTVAGGLGALLGIGGGVLLVPLLNRGFDLPFSQAAAISLVGVLGTSAAMSTTSTARRLLNPRLALLLLVFSVSGAVAGAKTVHLLQTRTLELIFGATAALVAVSMLARGSRRNILPDVGQPLGALDGRLFDDDTGRDVVYRVRRVPLALVASVAAGLLASYIGVGGGIVIVPVLNAWCGVPMRAAAATSAFMIGVTAVPGVTGFYASGLLGDFHLAGATVAGVLAGYRLGSRQSSAAPVWRLKTLMAMILAAVAAMYLR